MKLTSFLVLFCALLTSCSNAQDNENTSPNITVPKSNITYEKWKEEAKSNIRLFPKYGNAVKSKEQKEADQELIDDVIKQQGNRLIGSEKFVERGFDHYYEGDPKTAIYRFNQAWLLNPKNENVFWGFAAIYFGFGDLENAMKQLKEGLAINPKSSNILTDIATIYVVHFQTNNNQKDLSKAFDFFTQSYAIDPKNQNTLFKLSMLYYNINDCNNALRYYNECKALGGKPLTKEYIQEIEKRCGNKQSGTM